MLEAIKRGFWLGYREGWELFWSPFTGFWQVSVRIWRRRMKRD